MSALRYSGRLGGCGVLGPGRRAVLWVHGCCFRCEGCIAEGFRDSRPLLASPEEMAAWYLSLPETEGITISGGEPMLQAGALADMIRLIRREADAGVIVYTGFVYEALLERAQEDEGVSRLLACTDLLIDGPYIRAKDKGDYARGSSNQRLLLLTDRYAGETDAYYGRRSRDVEIRVGHDRLLLAGVPSAEQAALWRRIKEGFAADDDGRNASFNETEMQH